MPSFTMQTPLSVLLRLNRQLRYRFACARHAMRRAVFARLSFAGVERVALLRWLIGSLFDARSRASGIARYEAGRMDVGLAREHALRTMSADLRQRLLDECLYAGRALHRDTWPDLRAAGAHVAQRIREIKAREPGRAVLLSPFHHVSQYANIYVIDEVRKALGLASIAVVSGVPRDVYGEDAAMIPSVPVLYTYDSDSEQRNRLGLRVARALRRDGVLAIFADAAPFSLAKYPMETVGVTMSGRAARVHNGVFRLGAPIDACLLPFYLTLSNGRFDVQVGEPVDLAASDAPQRLAGAIDAARRHNYPDWLFAGHPCGYHFAPTR